MARDSWEKYVNTGTRISLDEDNRQLHNHGNGLWHIDGETLDQNYSDIRASEIETRNQEIFRRFRHFYWSKKGVIAGIISVLFGLATSSLSPEGLVFWNLLIAVLVWGFYEITVRTTVRAEWNEIWEEMKKL